MKITPQQAPDNVREIPLSRGMVALVDDDDYDMLVSVGKWHATPGTSGTYYANRSITRPGGGQTTQGMHTLISGWPYVDHRNGDGLDNRRANLRQATDSQNQGNRRIGSNNTSGYKGVSRSGLKWRARIRLDGHQTHMGCYATPQEAARAYDTASIKHFGEFARPNFPQGVDL